MNHRVQTEYGILILWTIIAITVIVFAPPGIYAVAFLTFGAVIAASLLIAWAAEASESSINRGLALAIVAIVQTIPEYFVEGTIAWKAGQDPTTWLANVIANFTGANRLLTGFGWPMILFTLIVQKRRKHIKAPSTISLRKEQSIEVVFMLGSSLYYLLILIERAITLLDSIILAGTFVGYMWLLARLPREKGEEEESLEGPPLALANIRSSRTKFGVIAILFLFTGLAFFFLSGPFVESIRQLADMFLVGLLGSGAVFFSIQWIAPVLSEFPEKVTAFNWARQIKSAPLALLNFISSSVNELTALVALIPIVVFVSSNGTLATIPLDGQQWIEVLLTMSQSLYACIVLFDLEYDLWNATVLFSLWLVSTVVIEARFYIAFLFLALSVFEFIRAHKRFEIFSTFRTLVQKI